MPLYLISRTYLPLVTVNTNSSTLTQRISAISSGMKVVRKKNITSDNLVATFTESNTKYWIACDKMSDAEQVVRCLLKNHDTHGDYIEDNVRYFATPVIYTFELERGVTLVPHQVTANELAAYADTSKIPLYDTFPMVQNELISSESRKIQLILNQQQQPINIMNVNSGQQIKNASAARYLCANGTSVAHVSLNAPASVFAFFTPYIPASVTNYVQNIYNGLSPHTD